MSTSVYVFVLIPEIHLLSACWWTILFITGTLAWLSEAVRSFTQPFLWSPNMLWHKTMLESVGCSGMVLQRRRSKHSSFTWHYFGGYVRGCRGPTFGNTWFWSLVPYSIPGVLPGVIPEHKARAHWYVPLFPKKIIKREIFCLLVKQTFILSSSKHYNTINLVPHHSMTAR